MLLRSWSKPLAAVLLISACSSAKQPASTSSRVSPTRRGPRVVRDTVAASRDPELERRVARLELRLMERDAQVEDLQARLDDARAEVVRAMAKLRTVASRAEAASGMAEAEVALQSLRSSASSGGAQPPEAAQAASLLRQSNAEFDQQNFGGALYLANQAKAFAALGRGRLTGGGRSGGGAAAGSRPGESAFAVPIRLRVTSRGNVREGPGTGFAVAFGVESGTVVTGLSYSDEWIRISDDGGRGGWIARALVGRP